MKSVWYPLLFTAVPNRTELGQNDEVGSGIADSTVLWLILVWLLHYMHIPLPHIPLL